MPRTESPLISINYPNLEFSSNFLNFGLVVGVDGGGQSKDGLVYFLNAGIVARDSFNETDRKMINLVPIVQIGNTFYLID